MEPLVVRYAVSWPRPWGVRRARDGSMLPKTRRLKVRAAIDTLVQALYANPKGPPEVGAVTIQWAKGSPLVLLPPEPIKEQPPVQARG